MCARTWIVNCGGGAELSRAGCLGSKAVDFRYERVLSLIFKRLSGFHSVSSVSSRSWVFILSEDFVSLLNRVKRGNT